MSPRSESTRRRTRREVAIVIAVSAVAVALLYTRLPSAADQLWAEDGRDFLGDALDFGALKAFGHSEAGYYQSMHRVGAAIATLVPLRNAAFITWLWVAMVTAWMVATVMVASRTWLRTWVARIVVALALVLVPVLGSESIGNAANLQFSLLFVSLVLLIGAPRTPFETVNGVVLLVATGLTTPLAVVLLPVSLLRMLRRRSWRPDALVIAWLVGLSVQFILLAVTRPQSEPRTAQSASELVRRLEMFGVELNLLPVQFERYRGPVFLIGFAVVTLAVAVVAWRHRERARAVVLVAVPLTGVGMVSALTLTSGAANRYLVFTGLCLVWTVMAGAETLGDALRGAFPAARVVLTTAAAAVLLVTFALNSEPSELRQSGPTWHEALAEAQAICADRPDGAVRVQTAPLQAGRPDQWTVVIDCAELD